MMNTIYAGPKRGADRAVLLAHGAGSDMHAATLARVADALAAAKIPSLRFNYPYRDAGRKSPDRAAVRRPRVPAAEVGRRHRRRGGRRGCRGRGAVGAVAFRLTFLGIEKTEDRPFHCEKSGSCVTPDGRCSREPRTPREGSVNRLV